MFRTGPAARIPAEARTSVTRISYSPGREAMRSLGKQSSTCRASRNPGGRYGFGCWTDFKIEHVDGGRIEAWQRLDGLFGVRLLPNEGQPGYPGYSYTSTEAHDGFPDSYDVEALLAWGRAKWAERSGH
jgi:hypothetical protein